MARLASALLLLLACGAPLAAHAKTLVKVGDGQCNGGVGGTGEHYCLIGGTCNEGGTPVPASTQAGTKCPGTKEYLLCQEDSSINASTCRAACEADNSCVGFLVTNHAAKASGRCELHTKKIEYAAAALECFTYANATSTFTLIGKGACRTRAPTVGGPQSGTHYGNMQVVWVNTFADCRVACMASATPCVGVEYHRTAVDTGKFKCEVHFEELSASEMSIFACYAQPTCRNAHTCSGRRTLRADASNLACAPGGTGGLAACTDALCCLTPPTSTHISAAVSARPLLLLGLAGVRLLTA